MKCEVEEAFRRILIPLIERYPKTFPKSVFSFSQFYWAWLCVRSRCFSRYLPYSSMLPFADLLNHVNSSTTYGWDPNTDALIMRASGQNGSQPGQEVFNFYGPRGNRFLLLHYGFAFPDNHFDTLSLSVRAVRWVNDTRMVLRHNFLLEIQRLCLPLYFFCRLVSVETHQSTSELSREIRALETMHLLCSQALASFPTSLEEDELIKPGMDFRMHCARAYRSGRKLCLRFQIDFALEFAAMLRHTSPYVGENFNLNNFASDFASNVDCKAPLHDAVLALTAQNQKPTVWSVLAVWLQVRCPRYNCVERELLETISLFDDAGRAEAVARRHSDCSSDGENDQCLFFARPTLCEGCAPVLRERTPSRMTGWSQPEAPSTAARMSAGSNFTVVLLDTGELLSCGANSSSQLGHYLDEAQGLLSAPFLKPVLVPPGIESSQVISVVCGSEHTLCLTETRQVFAWGCNVDGQCGVGSQAQVILRRSPVMIPEGASIVSLSCGQNFSLALSDSGTIYSWGDNQFGQCCRGSLVSLRDLEEARPSIRSLHSCLPATIAQPDGVAAFAFMTCGWSHACAVTVHGEVFSWGDNTHNALATSSAHALARSVVDGVLCQPVCAPTQWDAAERRIRHVAAGHCFTVAVDDQTGLWAWGKGFGGADDNPVPFLLPPLPDYKPTQGLISEVATGHGHILALLDSGHCFQFGSGDSEFDSSCDLPSWTRVDVASPVTRIACGGHHSLALTADGVFSWGEFGVGCLSLNVCSERAEEAIFYGFRQLLCEPLLVHAIECSSCHVEPIQGILYRCLNCESTVSLCSQCMFRAPRVHDSSHVFLCFKEQLPPTSTGRIQLQPLPFLDTNVHEGVQCNGCEVKSITGWRFKCVNCAEHNECWSCFQRGHSSHPSSHVFMALQFSLPLGATTTKPLLPLLYGEVIADLFISDGI